MSAQSFDLDLPTLTPDNVRQGVPAELIDTITDLGLDRDRVLRLVGAPSTLRRRIKDRARLTRGESDRLARLGRVVGQAVTAFGSPAKAVHWLQRPVRSRADRATPLDLLDTDPGSEWVAERLVQIAHGMFA